MHLLLKMQENNKYKTTTHPENSYNFYFINTENKIKYSSWHEEV